MAFVLPLDCDVNRCENNEIFNIVDVSRMISLSGSPLPDGEWPDWVNLGRFCSRKCANKILGFDIVAAMKRIHTKEARQREKALGPRPTPALPSAPGVR
ncbi:MAG: hypothetical protein P4M00_09160 [Azospirillaceae bacterium]|nr:hypothetical protein [Azospirillaceae bacterium]